MQNYEILSKLGAGSFGVVHKARDKKTNNIVVIKVVDISKMNAKLRKNAMEEGKILREMNSLYIVKHFNTFIIKSNLHIVMEYCPKGDLAGYMKAQMGKPLKQDKIWKFSIQMMAGLRDLHLKKILHRDIKSLNVFLDADHNIRIGDLGVAKALKSDFAYTIVGTPYYLSPEMCEQKPYNQKTDIWAMGCIIYELCTGKHPFEANNQAALALKIVMGKYESIPSHYSPDLSWVVQSCLSVDYKRRPGAAYLLSMPKVEEWAKRLNIPLSSSETKLAPLCLASKDEENYGIKPEPTQQNKMTEFQQKVPKDPTLKGLISPKISDKVLSKQARERQTGSKVGYKKDLPQNRGKQRKASKDVVIKPPQKAKDEQNAKSKIEFFERMKLENECKRLSAARKMELQEKRGHLKAEKPARLNQQCGTKYESEKPVSTPDDLLKKNERETKKKMNLTMNRFLPESVKQKQEFDIQDASGLDKVDIPDSESSEEQMMEKKGAKVNHFNRMIQMVQQQVDEGLLAQQFGLFPVQKKPLLPGQGGAVPADGKEPSGFEFVLDNKTKTINWDLDDVDEKTATVEEIKSQLEITPESDNQKKSIISNNALSNIVQKNTGALVSKSRMMKELPTVKDWRRQNELELKVMEDEEMSGEEMSDEMEEQINENRAYISDEQEEEDRGVSHRDGEQLLIEDFDQKQQDLSKKYMENEKRKAQLERLKHHNESQILKIVPKKEYEKMKSRLIECREDDVQQFVASWKNNLQAINLFYRIIHFDMEINRCLQNMEKIKQRLLDVQKNKA